MSAKIFGINAGDIKPMPDFSARATENNTWEARQSFRILTSDWDVDNVRTRFEIGSTLVSLWPDCPIWFQNLRVIKPTPRILPGGMMEVSCRFTGGWFSTFNFDNTAVVQGVTTYAMEASLAEYSIMEHEDVASFSVSDKDAIQGLIDGKYTWNTDTGKLAYQYASEPVDFSASKQPGTAAKNWCLKVVEGKATFLRPSFIWRSTQEGTTGLTDSDVSSLGKIVTPPGSPPKPSANHQWISSGATQEQQGEVYRITLEWTLSGPNGWDSLFY